MQACETTLIIADCLFPTNTKSIRDLMEAALLQKPGVEVVIFGGGGTLNLTAIPVISLLSFRPLFRYDSRLKGIPVASFAFLPVRFRPKPR